MKILDQYWCSKSYLQKKKTHYKVIIEIGDSFLDLESKIYKIINEHFNYNLL